MMQWASEVPPSEVNYIGLAICSTGENQRHAGIIYKRSKDEPWNVVHLAQHHQLCNDKFIDPFLWSQCPYDDLNLNFMAGACGECIKLSDKIPYGFSLDGISFDPHTGNIQIGEQASGLTCATFVLKLFKDYGYDLLDLETWDHRDEDIEWKNSIIDSFETAIQRGASYLQPHVEKLKGNTDFRCRPEEVTAAACKEEIPLDFDTAQKCGFEIVDKLKSKERYPPPAQRTEL